MNKILNLKSWYTLEQCCQRLELELGHKVTTQDLLQLVYDRQLTVSWLRNQTLYQRLEREEHHFTPIYYEEREPPEESKDWICDLSNNVFINTVTNEQSKVMPKILEDAMNLAPRLKKGRTLEFHLYIPLPKHEDPIQVSGPQPIDLSLNKRFEEFVGHLLLGKSEFDFDFTRDHTHDPERTGSIYGIILQIEGQYYEQVDDRGYEIFDPDFPRLEELVFRRNDVELFIGALTPNDQQRTISTKSNNKQIKTIAALGSALIGGLTGIKNTDAASILAALDLKGLDRPVSQKKLAEYLGTAYELD